MTHDLQLFFFISSGAFILFFVVMIFLSLRGIKRLKTFGTPNPRRMVREMMGGDDDGKSF